jgi:hypothetical protein
VDLALALLALLPLALPVPWLWRLLAPRDARRWLVVGYGLLAGLLGWPLLLRGLDVLGIPLAPGVLWALFLGFAAATVVVPRRRPVGPAPLPGMAIGSGQRLLLVLLGTLLVLRLGGLVLEVYWRPLYPFDATMHWATKARVWSAYRELLPFVDNAQWLREADARVFTDHHPAYPRTVPLLQAWMAIAVGYWHPSLVNLPWLLCVFALGAAFYGQVREAGAQPLTALVFTWFLLTLPLLNTHVALAGYADLLLGTAYCLALMALFNAIQGGARWQWALALGCALGCALIKNEGFFWMLTLVPAGWVAWRGGRGLLRAMAAVGAVALVVLLFFPRELVLAGHSLASLDLHYRSGSLAAIGRSLFLYDNWHFGAWLPPVLLALVAWRTPRGLRHCAPLLAALGSALVLFIFLFTCTQFAIGAIRHTAVGRISLHLLPASLFLASLLYGYLLQESRLATQEEAR